MPSTSSNVSPSWFKSSHSGGNATECVEASHFSKGTAIRDSKTTEGEPCSSSHTRGRRSCPPFRMGAYAEPEALIPRTVSPVPARRWATVPRRFSR
ncbi:DUF397 domain-containing protein [Streptomyces sp. b94]|uniref:DUF397 domain-containing protein n=1 Tax=Streptomyces sp. b94 TaxID=1827634 RepID=UPI000D1BA5B2|nr:DUF397 domain-containing protein [Streptomyces sp. b94]